MPRFTSSDAFLKHAGSKFVDRYKKFNLWSLYNIYLCKLSIGTDQKYFPCVSIKMLLKSK